MLRACALAEPRGIARRVRPASLTPFPRAQTLREVLRLPPAFGIDPAHLGVLFALDRRASACAHPAQRRGRLRVLAPRRRAPCTPTPAGSPRCRDPPCAPGAPGVGTATGA